MTKEEICKRLITNDALFKDIYVIKQNFDIIPKEKEHIGACITYQDIQELRNDFLEQLVDTFVDWVYSSEKYLDIKEQFIKQGKSESAAASAVIRKAKQKFRKGSDDTLLVQGQLGELLLFHFIQRFMQAVPLLRKMPITTSSEHERFGADAIHYRVDGEKNTIILGEAKAYTSKYKFSAAFEDAITSILSTYGNHRKEINLYLHEDFLDHELDQVAEDYLNNSLPNVQVELVSIILYNETRKISLNSEPEIKEQVKDIIEKRFADFDDSKIPIEDNPILKRITYIAFPIWKFEDLANDLQNMI